MNGVRWWRKLAGGAAGLTVVVAGAAVLPTVGGPPAPSVDVVGDRVWFDEDRNGIQDHDERGAPNVEVRLVDARTGRTLGRTSTGGTGNYRFDGLASRTCVYVEVDPPAGYEPSPADRGAGPAADAVDSDLRSEAGLGLVTSPWACPGHTSGTGARAQTWWDIGLVVDGAGLGSIGDRVWLDRNADGVQDPGEPGAPAVEISLYDNTAKVKVGTVVSDRNGRFRFTGLARGHCYQLLRPALAGHQLTGANRGRDDRHDSDLGPNDERSTSEACIAHDGDNSLTHQGWWDIGFVPGASSTGALGDRVWRDDDGNGIQDPAEPGIPAVQVTLTDAAGRTQTQVTGANGHWNASGLEPGRCYRLSLASVPTGYTVAPLNAGSDDAKDSDIAPGANVADRWACIRYRGDDKLVSQPWWDIGLVPATEAPAPAPPGTEPAAATPVPAETPA